MLNMSTLLVHMYVYQGMGGYVGVGLLIYVLGHSPKLWTDCTALDWNERYLLLIFSLRSTTVKLPLRYTLADPLLNLKRRG